MMLSRCTHAPLRQPQHVANWSRNTSCRPVLRQSCQLPAACSENTSYPLPQQPTLPALAALSAMPVTLAAFLLSPAVSWAVTDEDALVEATSLESVLAATQEAQSGYDLFVSIIFGIVVVLLSVVTLGVGYLSLKTWLDSRQEKQDQEAATKGTSTGSSNTSGKKADKDLDEEAVTSLRQAARTKLDKSKGFGQQLAKGPKEF